MAEKESALPEDYIFLQDHKEDTFGDIDKVIHDLQLSTVLKKHTDVVTALTTMKGYLVSGAADNTIKIWCVESIQEIATFEGHTSAVLSLAEFNGCLASGSYDNSVILWDFETGEKIHVLEGHTGAIESLAVVKSYLASASWDCTVGLWDVGAKKVVFLEGHTSAVNCLEVANGYLASGSDDKTIRLWDIEAQKQIAVLTGHIDIVESLTMAGEYLVSGSKDTTVRLWSTETFQLVGPIEGNPGAIRALTWFDGYLGCGSTDNTIRLWDIEAMQEVAVLEGHTNGVISLTTINGYLVSGSWDNDIRFWEISSGEESSVLEKNSDLVRSLTEMNGFLAAGLGNEIKVWNPTTGEKKITLKGHTGTVRSLTPLGEYLVSGSFDSTIRVWDIDRGQQITVLEGHKGAVTCLARVGDWLASGSNDEKILLWAIDTGKKVGVLKEHTKKVNCLAAIGDYLVSGSDDKTIRVWNPRTQKRVAVLVGHTDDVNCLVEINDCLASGSGDKTIRIWEVETREQVSVLQGHTGSVNSLTKVEGNLVSASKDKTIVIWSIAEKRQVAVIRVHSDTVFCLSKINNYLVSGSWDGTIRLTKINYKYRRFPGVTTGIHALKTLATKRAYGYHRSINEIAIMPQGINILHILAYQGRDKVLKEALEYGCHFAKSSSGKTPLSIALEQENERCVEAILSYLGNLENKESQKSMLSRISQDLPKLIGTNSIYIKPVLEAIISSFTDSIRISQVPMYIKTQSPLPARPESSSDFKDVKIGHTKMGFNSLEGSQGSIDLIRALESTERSECLRSDFVQTLVGYKWEKLRWVFWLLAFLKLLSIGLITAVTFSESNSTKEVLMWAFLIDNFFFTLFEMVQVFSLKYGYFYSFKNYIDISRLILGFIFGIQSLVSEFENFNSSNLLTIATSILFWLEGIAAFELFRSTRYYVLMIEEVIKDIRGFLLILVYFVTAYCSVFGTTTNSDFSNTFKLSYDLLLGDFSSSELNDTQWFVFVIGSILNLIIMLNLLISIISDSFDRIKVEQTESETRVRLGLVLEIENTMFWNRDKGEPTFFSLITEYEEGGQQDLENKIKKLEEDTQDIKNKIEEVSENTQKNSEKIDKLLSILTK